MGNGSSTSPASEKKETQGDGKDSCAPRLRTMGRSNSIRFTPGEQALTLRQPREKTAEEEAMIASSLANNPNLRRLAPFNEGQVKTLVEAAWKQIVQNGTAIMTEGDLNNGTFYIVGEGTFDIDASEPFEVVTVQGMSYLSRPEDSTPGKGKDWSSSPKTKTVRQVGKNASFGDSSMLYGTPRWGTIRALEQAVVWVISQSNFKVVQMQSKEGHTTEKSPEDAELIAEALRKNENLQRLTPLGTQHIKELTRVAWREELAEGQVLMSEGDLNADAFYIVGGGSLEFVGREPFEVATHGDVSHLSRAAHTGEGLDRSVTAPTVRILGRGLVFGEISMLYCAPRFATVTALKPSVMWAIDRSNFQLIQMKAAEDEMLDRVKYLDQLGVMKSFSAEDREKLAVVMETTRFTKGDVLEREGEVGTGLYILCEGTVAVASEKQTFEADPAWGKVHCFGEGALLGQEPRPETVEVTSASATALVLEREEFMTVCDRLLEAAPSPAFERYATTTSKVGPKVEKLSLDALVKIGLLGCGEMGPVELHQQKGSKDLYALKRMNKGLIVQKGLRKSVMRERVLWMEVISPFIIRAFAAFRSDQTLSLLLEPALGGDLSAVYAGRELHGREGHAKYYLAGVVLALEHLHKRKIIFRNVKPENILLSVQGHPKLTDMSLAKRVVGHTFTTCGTPTYMAPEIVAGTGHSRAVDWWSVGVLLFWMMAGKSPFQSDHPMEVYAKVMRGIARVGLPASCGSAVGDLIAALLRPIPIDRLAMRQGGVAHVERHAWLANFDWAAMRADTLQPPYAPAWKVPPQTWKDAGELPGSALLEHVSADAGRLPQPLEYHDDGSDWDAHFAT